MKTGMPSAQRGVSLIEILVAIFVLAIGLLGILSMELFTIRMNQEAYLRSQAMLQVQELADRMHANPVGVDDGAYQQTIVASDQTTAKNCLAEGCTPWQLAQFDLWEWNKSNQDYLPSGAGSVSYDGTTGVHTITVSWLEKEQEGLEGSETKTFSFAYKPLPLSLNIAPEE